MGCVCCCGIPIICSVPPKWSAWIYYIGFLAVSIISWVLREYGGSVLDSGPASGCTEEGTCSDLAVLRLSFGSVLFFATMGLITLGVTENDNPRAKIHTGFWLFKFVVWGALIASTFAMPNESAGLMTSAAVFAYSIEPYVDDAGLPRECVPAGSGGTGAVQIISFILVMLCLSLTTTNSGKSSTSFSLVETQNDAGDDEDGLNYRPDFFYLTFMLASSYVGMVLTGWGLNKVDQDQFAVDTGWGSVWAKMSASWLCAILYTWSLIAHKVLTSRNF
ncbi:hypothetical protein KSW81_007890 [Nannochloris sp. 'desiccata']|nr:hypothetical protein KSW81_007890 [Chlorella desiccata (nom. nud.)]